MMDLVREVGLVRRPNPSEIAEEVSSVSGKILEYSLMISLYRNVFEMNVSSKL
jgi:hypothetical protein